MIKTQMEKKEGRKKNNDLRILSPVSKRPGTGDILSLSSVTVSS